MRRTRPELLFLMGALVATADLYAQEPLVIRPGQKVRVISPILSSASVTGEVLAADELGFVLRTETGREFSVDRREADSVWVWSGTSGSSRQGAIIGAGIGLLAGIVIGVRSDCEWLFTTSEGSCPGFHASAAGIWGIFMGAGGALVGAALGELVRHDNWLEVQPRPSLHRSMPPHSWPQ